jgi:hypothetical protein
MECWTAQETTHTSQKKQQTKVISLCGTEIEIIEAKKKVSIVYNLQVASRKQCCSSKSSYQDHLPRQTWSPWLLQNKLLVACSRWRARSAEKTNGPCIQSIKTHTHNIVKKMTTNAAKT